MKRLFVVTLLFSFLVLEIASSTINNQHHHTSKKHESPQNKAEHDELVPTNQNHHHHHRDAKEPQHSPTQQQPHLRQAGIQYIGCYEGNEVRTLPFNGILDYTSYGVNEKEAFTFDNCFSTCYFYGYQYLGFQYGSQCFCGMDLPNPVYGTCDMPCEFDSGMICGGVWSNSVYFLGYNPKYVGCFEDNPSRVFPLEAGAPNKDWSPTSCMNWCGDEGYTLAGLEYGGQCFCGNYGPYISTDTCNMFCSSISDDPNSLCGGVWSLSVYHAK